MYRGYTKRRNMTVHEFLCLMRNNCKNGCSKCILRDSRVETDRQKQMCIFSKFDMLSDKSLLYISTEKDNNYYT